MALRSAGADSAQDHTRVALLPLPSASSYTYVSPNGLAEGYGTHEIADWALTHDGRDVRLFVAVGLAGGRLGDDGRGVGDGASVRRCPRTDGCGRCLMCAVDRRWRGPTAR